MVKFKLELPFEPYDTVYYVTKEGIYQLTVTQIQIQKHKNKTQAYICFPNFPFIPFEEYGINLFTDLKEAEKIKKRLDKSNKMC